MRQLGTVLALLGTFLLLAAPARAERVEVLASIKGARPLRVMGKGIVVGLRGTGDDAAAARKALQQLLSKERMDVDMADLDGSNIAIVSVTAEIPAFTRPGAVVPVKVASIYDAESLENGILLTTQLRAVPGGPVYAVASGRLLIGGENQGEQFPTTASIPASLHGGAQVVRSEDVEFLSERNTFELNLNQPSFSVAESIAQAINSNSATNPRLDQVLEDAGFDALNMSIAGYAQALDAGRVIVRIPERYLTDKVRFISAVMKDVNVNVDAPPRVVINRATNTVVVTGEVRVGRAAIAHGDLTVMIERPQNAPAGATAQFQRPDQEPVSLVEVSESEQGRTENLRALLNTLNAMKARPRDIIAIVEALHRAGALHAELVNE
ncbi:MAG: flagellar basal body P-ring protein FlgI [Planctomycetota bacterium]